MATYYKYAEREKTNQIDWNKISTDINKSMAAIEAAKEARRSADQKALNDSLTRLMEKPVGEDLAENQRIANYTQQAEEVLLNDLRLLKRGDISRRDYNLKYNNVKMGTDRAFSLSKQYQDSYQMHVDRLKADENGKVIASNLEGEMLGKLEQYGIASGSQYYINPITGDVSLALTSGEGEEGDVKIGESQFDLMGLGTAKNIIFQKIDKYQTQDQVQKIAENLKTTALDELDPSGFKGYITTTKGLDIDALFEIKDGFLTAKEGTDGEALLSQINSTFAGNPFSKASFLSDTIGTIDGKAVEMVFPDAEGNFVDTGNHQIRMKLDKQGRYVPEITEDQQKIIDKNMVALVKSSIDSEFGIKADTRLDDKQRFDIGQINRKLAEEKDSLRLSMDTISELYKGGAVDLEVATTYFKNIDPGVRKVERNDNGIILTIEDDDGNVRKETVSFFAQDDGGNILEDKPLSERQFIQAASNLLLGTDKTETKEFRQLWNRRDNDGNFVYGGDTRSEGRADVGEGITGRGGRVDTTQIDAFLDKKFEKTESNTRNQGYGASIAIDFRDEDYQVVDQIQDAFKDTDIPIKAVAVGGSAKPGSELGSGFSDLVEVRIDGYNKPPLTLSADEWSSKGARPLENQLREYIKGYMVSQLKGGGRAAKY
jgi:hypothetical protein